MGEFPPSGIGPGYAAQDKQPGEVLGVLGPNGAGKTTLLRALSGLHALTSDSTRLGSLTLDDEDSDTFVPAERRPVALAFQNYRLAVRSGTADKPFATDPAPSTLTG